ncbi:hypothetical protein T4D_12026 [Trichinella pseudospiralis]|uniref:Uncharacterized protein n=1 Tax=Trichinella pseudospiralis TaxID=6337 RepID=A0A0V1FNG7_TRIPS|nr:hypothetical protein T4D_12026 [Trichinella pseudospiralis]
MFFYSNFPKLDKEEKGELFQQRLILILVCVYSATGGKLKIFSRQHNTVQSDCENEFEIGAAIGMEMRSCTSSGCNGKACWEWEKLFIDAWNGIIELLFHSQLAQMKIGRL